MKIHVLSDLHIEFEPFALPETDADVVVLAGDIGVGTKGLEYAQSVAAGRPKIYVAGNHEYYGGALPHLTEKLSSLAANTEAHFLENSEIILGNVRFLGCTLWTDFKLFGDAKMTLAMAIAGDAMNDFRRIRLSPRFSRFTPKNSIDLHLRSRTWLRKRLAEPFSGRTVVVTHHAPSPGSNSERYRSELLSAAFISDLDEMMTGDRVALWIHGHTHHCVDFEVAGTRVLSNQRGYPHEAVPGFRPNLVVEVYDTRSELSMAMISISGLSSASGSSASIK